MAQLKLVWQSKLVLLLVLPAVAASVVLETHWWAEQMAPVAIWTIGLSLVLGLVALETHSSTLGGAAAGAAVMASLMFSTVIVPYLPWQTALPPVLMVLLLTSVATRVGRGRKEELGIAERKEGRAASQVAANLGFAALVTGPLVQSWLSEANWLPKATLTPMPGFALGLAALAEAAADHDPALRGPGNRWRRKPGRDVGWCSFRRSGGRCRQCGHAWRSGHGLDQLVGRRLRPLL